MVDNMSRFHTGEDIVQEGCQVALQERKTGEAERKNIRWGAMSDPENEKKEEKKEIPYHDCKESIVQARVSCCTLRRKTEKGKRTGHHDSFSCKIGCNIKP